MKKEPLMKQITQLLNIHQIFSTTFFIFYLILKERSNRFIQQIKIA